MQQKLHLRRLLRDSNFMVLENAQRFNLGRFGIVSCEPGFITIEQRESIRKLLSRRLKPLDGQFWLNITYFVPFTKKSKASRMGKGIGSFLCLKAPIKKGHIICEFIGPDEHSAWLLYKSISKKLPIKTSFINNDFN